MARRIREFVDIKDHLSLDQLIDKLEQIRETLPQECSAELRLSGDEVFGRKLTISYLRELTQSEEELEARVFAWAKQSAEAREGMRAFAEKRAPVWPAASGEDIPDLDAFLREEE